MKITNLICLASSILSLAACTVSTSGSSASYGSCSTIGGSANATLATNQQSLTIGGAYVNEITTSVTICDPRAPSNCQTIPNVLVDTGSNGLRLFHCAVTVSLPNVTDGDGTTGNPYGTCVTYADTSSHWGSVKQALVKIGNLTSSAVSVQVIDASFGSVPPSCTNLETDPSLTGYNGIIGVGLLQNDCPSCISASSNQNPQYYSCSGSGCAYTCTDSTCVSTVGANIVQGSQVTNPISKMPSGNNNGVSIAIPTIGDSGSPAINSAVLTVGISTVSNSNIQVFKTDSSLNFTTNYSGITSGGSYSFIDSGSNAYYFPDTTLATCGIQGYTFYCPSNTVLTAQMVGSTGSSAGATGGENVKFLVTDARIAINSTSNSVYPGFAGAAISSGGFDWGLNFFMGRTVYVGIQGISSTVNSTSYNRFWAFDTTVTPNPN